MGVGHGAYRRPRLARTGARPRSPVHGLGAAPLVRMRANCSWRERVAVSVNRLPAAPSAETTCVSTVPSAYVQVTVRGPAPGVPYPGAQAGALFRRRFALKTAVAACSAW